MVTLPSIFSPLTDIISFGESIQPGGSSRHGNQKNLASGASISATTHIPKCISIRQQDVQPRYISRLCLPATLPLVTNPYKRPPLPSHRHLDGKHRQSSLHSPRPKPRGAGIYHAVSLVLSILWSLPISGFRFLINANTLSVRSSPRSQPTPPISHLSFDAIQSALHRRRQQFPRPRPPALLVSTVPLPLGIMGMQSVLRRPCSSSCRHHPPH
ncbi:hypothetical protein B0H63DRAFT_537985 [Podospora didyma]|uniref:Uncharacterized protein n=1 Tax=Podospora didyma TaxID=330526 RepID=A0AAE0U3V2_9PEZI|nr:hypothetical protein B0H63DRAFT_537985 [Podospora didyma]